MEVCPDAEEQTSLLQYQVEVGAKVSNDLWTRTRTGSADCPISVAVSAFDYVHPQTWGQTVPLCAFGLNQSPIDLEPKQVVEHPSKLTTNYKLTADLTFSNNGHAVEVDSENPSVSLGSIQLQVPFLQEGSPVTYGVKQFHMHHPSEHTLAGRHFDGELHIVHGVTNAAPGDAPTPLAVVGLWLESCGACADNPCLSALLTKDMPAAGCGFELDSFDLSCFSQELSGPFYSYQGSLTTPACAETVTWSVMATPVQISGAQLAALVSAVHIDNRPTQVVGNRSVYFTSFQSP